jgi:hypothetical protein
MSSHDPFGHLKHKLWPKEKLGVKLAQISGLPTTKSQNRPDFLVFRWHATCRWKALDERYNFALNLISIEGLYIKLWRRKVAGVPTLGISRQNDIWVLVLWPST